MNLSKKFTHIPKFSFCVKYILRFQVHYTTTIAQAHRWDSPDTLCTVCPCAQLSPSLIAFDLQALQRIQTLRGPIGYTCLAFVTLSALLWRTRCVCVCALVCVCVSASLHYVPVREACQKSQIEFIASCDLSTLKSKTETF